jgi:hypothetical protein
MGQLIIDDPHGFDTVFSADPVSPAGPYLREYQPRSLEDLYEIGVIPKHVSIDTLRQARKHGLQAGARYMNISSPTVRNLPAETRKQYVEARSNTASREASVRATAEALITQHGFGAEQADLLARKAHSFDEYVKETIPLRFVSVLLADDLIVRTPLVIDASIQSLKAKAVIIHRAGEIRAKGSYFLLECNSVQGEGLWFHGSEFFGSQYQGISRAQLQALQRGT